MDDGSGLASERVTSLSGIARRYNLRSIGLVLQWHERTLKEPRHRPSAELVGEPLPT